MLSMTFIVIRWKLDNIYLGRFTPQREDVPYVALQEVFVSTVHSSRDSYGHVHHIMYIWLPDYLSLQVAHHSNKLRD